MVVESESKTGPHGSLNAILPLLGVLEAQGFDAKALLHRAGIPATALEDVQMRLPRELLERFWQIGSEVMGDPAIALRVATLANTNTLGTIGYLASASESLRTALEINKDLTSLLLEDVVCELESVGEAAFFRCSMGPVSRRSPYFMEYAIGLTVTMSRLVGAVGTDPLEANFTYSAPAHADEYERILRLPVRFDAPENGVLYPISMMDGLNPSADIALRQLLEQHAADQLAKIPSGDPLSHRVRVHLRSVRPLRGLTSNAIAARFSMSDRTLRRRLRDEGTSYQEILDDVRSELARHYLAKEKRGIDDVAYILGFSDPSAFTKAFRRWTGMTPAEIARGDSA